MKEGMFPLFMEGICKELYILDAKSCCVMPEISFLTVICLGGGVAHISPNFIHSFIYLHVKNPLQVLRNRIQTIVPYIDKIYEHINYKTY
jgi:hypothetical protein